jgi:RecB family exonuclease
MNVMLSADPVSVASRHVPGRLVLTPNPRAAATPGVKSLSLLDLARAQLERAHVVVLDPLRLPRLLREVARDLGWADPAGAARRLGPITAEILRAGLDPAALAAFPDARVQRVAAFVQAHVARLRAMGTHDPAEILQRAARLPLERQKVLVTGYPRLGADEEAFVRAIAAPGSVLLLPGGDPALHADNEALAARLEPAGWTVEHDGTAPTRAPHLMAWHLPDPEAEVRAVLAKVRELLDAGIPARDVVLVARDDAAIGPLVLAVAHEYDVPVNASYQVPVASTRTGHWLAGLAEVVEQGLPFEATFRLLAHPLARALDGPKRLEARKHHPAGGAAWGALGVPVAVFDGPDDATGPDWLAWLERVLETFTIPDRVRRWPAEAIALARFREALEVLVDGSAPPLPRAAFLEDFREALERVLTPAHPGREGVALHTPLALYGARVPHVFVLGAHEDAFPARLQDDPVLDFTIRKRLAAAGLGLETAPMAARRERLSVEALLDVATTSLTLTAPRSQGGKACLPGPVFGWLGLVPVEPPPVVVSAQEARRRRILSAPDPAMPEDAALAGARVALEVERRREAPGSHAVPDPHDGGSGRPVDWTQRTFSASQLSTLGQCAFRWFTERVLHIKEPEEAIDGAEPQVRGLLYHKTLELAVQAATDPSGPAANRPPDPDGAAIHLRETVLDVLDACFLQAEQAIEPELGYALSSLSGWAVKRQEHLEVLRRAVRHEGFLDAGFQELVTEAVFQGVWRGFPVRGMVDRLDVHADRLVVLDYKAGSATYGKVQDAGRRNTIDLQLPIYVETAAAAIRPGFEAHDAAYFTLARPKRIPSKIDDEALEVLVERLQGHLEAGHFPVAPDLKRESCRYCDHAIVCRAGARLGRKED